MKDAERYTPGPWAICDVDSEPVKGTWMKGVTIYSEPTGKRIADTCWLNCSNDANARLIIAAPNLLGALKDLHADCVEYARINNLHNSDGSPATHHSMRRAATAIAKAEGKSTMTGAGAMGVGKNMGPQEAERERCAAIADEMADKIRGRSDAQAAAPYSVGEVAAAVNSWARTVAAKDAEIKDLNDCFSALKLVIALYDDNTRACFSLPDRKIVLDPPWVRQARAAIAKAEGHNDAHKS